VLLPILDVFGCAIASIIRHRRRLELDGVLPWPVDRMDSRRRPRRNRTAQRMDRSRRPLAYHRSRRG
jgi:hypothetical protein